MSKEKILSAKDLSKTFSNESVQQHVLKNLNLDVYKGDFTVVMGNSGSGKSTLLYALSGMDRPTLGSITYFVDDIKKDEKESSGEGIEISKFNNDKLALFRRNHAGFVFQQNYLNDTMSALDNVMVCGLLRTKDRKALAAKSKELLAILIDEKGLPCPLGKLEEMLWENNLSDKSSYIRNLVADIRKTLRACDSENILIHNYNQLAIDKNAIDCDYFDYLDGKPAASASFNFEYMSQYTWAESTLGFLVRKIQKNL